MSHGQGPVSRHLRRALHQNHGGLMFNPPPAHGNPDSPVSNSEFRTESSGSCADMPHEGPAFAEPDQYPEGLCQPADFVDERCPHSDELISGDQERAQPMGLDRAFGNRSIPAGPDFARQAERIVSIRLVRLQLQSGCCAPRRLLSYRRRRPRRRRHGPRTSGARCGSRYADERGRGASCPQVILRHLALELDAVRTMSNRGL